MRGIRTRLGKRPLKVGVFEYVTGGGMAGQDLPPSWASEGSAMRRAITRDFDALAGIDVIMSLDSRLPHEAIPFVETRIIPDPDGKEVFLDDVDYLAMIAPESDQILDRLIRTLESNYPILLCSGRQPTSLAGDKFRLANHWRERGIPTPPTWLIPPTDRKLPEDWGCPILFKPRFGAGSVDTVIVRDEQFPRWISGQQDLVAQPYVSGQPMSASFLVDRIGKSTLLGVGRQRIEVDEEGRISYLGGTILADVHQAPPAVEAAVASLATFYPKSSLRGFIGVDYIEDPISGVTVLEINPRPTTSYVGLAKMLGPGTIAGAWLDSMGKPLEDTHWPEQIRASRTGPDLTFNADGSFAS